MVLHHVVISLVCQVFNALFSLSQKLSSRGKEAQKAHDKESRKDEESELSNANKLVKDLSSNFNKKASSIMRKNESHEYALVMRELEFVKQELHKLKLDVASVLEAKSRAEEEIKASRSKVLSGSRTIEELKKEIEETNEDHVLAELARIEALKELSDISAQKEKEENDFLSKMEISRKKMKEAMKEIDRSKELEMKLAVTMSDVDLLQNELNSVREMDESWDDSLLHKITQELEEAKKELASIKQEGFEFMAAIDVIRNELNHVTSETTRLKKEGTKADSKLQSLNSKLLRAKSKLESVSNAEAKAKSICVSLSHSLDELKEETEAARREKGVTTQEIITSKEEIKETELHIDMTEEKLQSAMQELEMIKLSESEALEKLKILTENAMRERAIAAKHSSLITISKFEYEYLTNHAAVAEEIADRKVEAAQAWIEALNASEKEILVRTKIVLREIKDTKFEEEIIDQITTKKLVSKRVSSEELANFPRKRERISRNHLQRAGSRKSVRLSNSAITKFQKSASPAAKHVSPFTIKRRMKVIPNFGSLFKGKNTRNSYKREREEKQ